MPRQRIRERPSVLMVVGRIVPLVLALGLIWYGLMVLLLALKVSPSTINSISGYRTAFNYLSGLTPSDVDGGVTRAIIAGSGVLAFFVFGYLALKQLPRPYLARRELPLATDDHGEIHVEPRAVERLAEVAATMNPAVTDARGRYSVDDLSVDVSVRRARDLAEILQDTQRRVSDALQQHELPAMPVNVTLAGYDRRQRRELH
ncbi:MAG: hypothetical protein JO153_06710 [Solirubrobacterales bacterium]|nr:hypothetical protein [Solirubrobacterales bacterium]MBV9916178.1 hypothetical protein [Solirubrobacterales bacterium]